MQRKLVLPAARRAFTVMVVCVGSLVGGRAARAQAPHPPIVLVLDPCAGVDAQEVRRLVPIEMGAPLVPGAGDPRDTTRVSVGCVVGAPKLVRLEVRDPTTGRSLERVVTLEGVSKADQARLVAIASVELVAASQGDPGHAAGSASVPTAMAPSPPLSLTATPAPPRPAPARWRVLASGSLRYFAGLPRVLPGGDVALERALPRRLDVAADVAVESAGQPTALGDVDAFVASLGVVATLRAARGAMTWEAGLGARGGVARLAGEGTATVLARTVSEPWIGPVVVARATLALGRAFVASLGGEVGYVTSDVVGRVDGRPDLGVRGAWWNATLGVGFAR